MKGKWFRRTTLIAAGLVVAACNNSTTTTSGGPTTAFVTMRLTTVGGLDPGFAAGKGFVITDFDPNLFDFALAVAVQPADFKIIVGGSSGLAGQGAIALVRYAADGSSPDATFGTGGLVRTPTPAGWTSASASAIAVQADNKIVVAALAFNASGTTGVALVRYMPDGTLDTAFGTNGVVVTTIGPGFATDTCAMALQGTNIVVAGASSSGNIVLARYDSTGTLDTSFGTDAGGGKTTLSIGAQATSPGLAFQSAGAAIPGAIILVTGNGAAQVVLRYTANGAQDATFGGAPSGIVTTSTGGLVFANQAAVQSDDKIVVVGHANVNFILDTSDISLVRYNADGTVDTAGFNAAGATPGVVISDINGGFDNAFSIALTTPGAVPTSIVLSGNTGSAGFSRGIVLRYTSTGALDNSFGSNGVASLPLVGPSTIASGNAVAFQSTLGIVVAGYD